MKCKKCGENIKTGHELWLDNEVFCCAECRD